MKVYEFNGRSEKNRKAIFSSLIYAPGKPEPDLLDELKGKPFSRKWSPIHFCIHRPKLARPDFFAYRNSFIVPERLRKLSIPLLQACGEFLPVYVEGQKEKYYIFNITKSRDVLDPRKSKWERTPYGRKLLRPAFIPSRLNEDGVFKIPADFGVNMYTIERSGDPESEFKAFVEKNGLTGLEFELIWTD